uniref:MULE transposase domain-containing protein n=1 Tax=Plectus sambesii TaxID=2011161 RepID=A0A914W8X9_9BILA
MLGEQMRLIKSSRTTNLEGPGGMIGDVGGYLFHFDKQSRNGERFYWVCAEWHKSKCQARVTMDVAFCITKDNLNIHPNHFASAAQVEAVEAKAGMKRQAIETMDPTSAVVQTIRQDTSIGAIVHLPTTTSAARAVRRWRTEALAAPALPTSLEDLVIPEMYQSYEKRNPMGVGTISTPFMAYDSADPDCGGVTGKDGGDRCIFFASEHALKLVGSAKELYADGTFSITPGLFHQFYTIHVRYGKTRHTIPCIFAFMANRRKQTYIRMFWWVKELCPRTERNLQTVMTDFEDAALGAFETVWPKVMVKACFFHLTQNQRKKIVDAGLKALVDNNADIPLQVRMLRAMAFVPIADLDEVWSELVEVLDPRLEPLITYFDKWYMGKTVARRHRSPRFPQELWNMYDRTRNGDPRTNNSVEAYHRSLNTHFGVDHPSMWVACDKLQRYQQKLDTDYEDLIAKRHPSTTRPSKKWMKAEERKLKCVADYEEQPNKMDYLPRETQKDFFGKKGISWHITHVIRHDQKEQKLKQRTLVHIFDREVQDADAVVAILKDVLHGLKREDVQNIVLRSDNAGWQVILRSHGRGH